MGRRIAVALAVLTCLAAAQYSGVPWIQLTDGSWFNGSFSIVKFTDRDANCYLAYNPNNKAISALSCVPVERRQPTDLR